MYPFMDGLMDEWMDGKKIAYIFNRIPSVMRRMKFYHLKQDGGNWRHCVESSRPGMERLIPHVHLDMWKIIKSQYHITRGYKNWEERGRVRDGERMLLSTGMYLNRRISFNVLYYSNLALVNNYLHISK